MIISFLWTFRKISQILNPLAFLSLGNNGMKMIKIVHGNLPGVHNMADQGRIILQNYCMQPLNGAQLKIFCDSDADEQIEKIFGLLMHGRHFGHAWVESEFINDVSWLICVLVLFRENGPKATT